MPREPEVAGLLALIRLHRARAAARFSPSGDLVRLQAQDRSSWDQQMIDEAVELLTRARPDTADRGRTSCRRRSSPVTRKRSRGRTPTGRRSWSSTTCCCASHRPR
ncbi:DUF6596 domain-containing protein [Lentzea roselyniae]|uniref:DUF6596 domain-containing protein n=1 Tax=Lentzea roselyniae TaxID=531940 RepID=UPI003D154CF9